MHPPACGEAVVPAKQGVGGDDEPAQHQARQESGESGEDGTVGFGEFGSWHVAVQYRDLVAQRDGFGFERSARLCSGHEQADDGGEESVEDRTERESPGGGLASRHGAGTYRDALPASGRVHPAQRTDRVSGTFVCPERKVMTM